MTLVMGWEVGVGVGRDGGGGGRGGWGGRRVGMEVEGSGRMVGFGRRDVT